MGDICNKVMEEGWDEFYKNDWKRCKHGEIEVYGCWKCKTEERLNKIEQALGIGEDDGKSKG